MGNWISNRIRKARKKLKKFDAKYTTPQDRWLNRRLYGDKGRCGGCGRTFSMELENYRYDMPTGKVRCMSCYFAANGDMTKLWSTVK